MAVKTRARARRRSKTMVVDSRAVVVWCRCLPTAAVTVVDVVAEVVESGSRCVNGSQWPSRTSCFQRQRPKGRMIDRRWGGPYLGGKVDEAGLDCRSVVVCFDLILFDFVVFVFGVRSTR